MVVKRRCQTCQGEGTVRRQIKSGVYETRRCPARCNEGWVYVETI